MVGTHSAGCVCASEWDNGHSTMSDATTKLEIPSWTELDPAVREEWSPRIEQLVPAPPLLAEFGGPHLTLEEFDARSLADKVGHDAVLGARILATANSARFGLVKPMTSIQRAMVHLGFNLVKSVIISYVLEHHFGQPLPLTEEHVSYVRRWSSGASVVAFRWGQAVDVQDPSTVATVALLARVGTLLLGLATPPPGEDYRQLPTELQRLKHEQGRWQVSSPVLSAELVRRWGLPELVSELVGRSWEPVVRLMEPDPLDPYVRLVCLVTGSLVLTEHYIREPEGSPADYLVDDDYGLLRINLERHRLTEPLREMWHSARLQRELAALVD